MDILSTKNPVFCNYMYWTGVLAIKMLLMSVLTAVNRFRYKAFPNEECAKMNKVEVQFNDPHVERVRRAHRNDMENILPYFTVSLIYLCMDPNPKIATILFRIAAISRIIHTLVYAFYPVPQPARAIFFFITYLITFYMAFYVICFNMSYI